MTMIFEFLAVKIDFLAFEEEIKDFFATYN